jgi:esterase/lipase superfamily enzyme
MAGLSLGACSNRATGVMRAQAIPPDSGATMLPMLVATTRAASRDDDGTLFSGERGRGLSFVDVTVSIPPTHKTGEVSWPDSLPADPKRSFATAKAVVLDGPKALESLRSRLPARGGHVLLFVHGYNNRFEDAVYRFAQIAHDSNAQVVPVLFTWPSRGRTLSYPFDRESANFSRDALENVLRALTREPRIKEVSVLAHSMGNWVTLEALRQMAIRDGRVAAKVGNVMLAAPDVDIDVAATQIRGMGKPLPRITLFTSTDDRALRASRTFWGSSARLGAIDPATEPYRSALARFGITALDLTQLRTGDPLSHGKFAESPDVVRFIGRRLADNQTVGHEPSLGETIGDVVVSSARVAGHVAGAALTAPVAVIDPHSRQSFVDKLQQVAPTASDGATPIVGPLDASDVAVTRGPSPARRRP